MGDDIKARRQWPTGNHVGEILFDEPREDMLVAYEWDGERWIKDRVWVFEKELPWWQRVLKAAGLHHE